VVNPSIDALLDSFSCLPMLSTCAPFSINFCTAIQPMPEVPPTTIIFLQDTPIYFLVLEMTYLLLEFRMMSLNLGLKYYKEI
jgi:hypothetical protein